MGEGRELQHPAGPLVGMGIERRGPVRSSRWSEKAEETSSISVRVDEERKGSETWTVGVFREKRKAKCEPGVPGHESEKTNPSFAASRRRKGKGWRGGLRRYRKIVGRRERESSKT